VKVGRNLHKCIMLVESVVEGCDFLTNRTRKQIRFDESHDAQTNPR